jgi:translation initiation factor 2 beta subunit (eIF-2beta)/eIF-5
MKKATQVSISIDSLEEIKNIISIHPPWFKGLQSAIVEWGIRQALKDVESGFLNRICETGAKIKTRQICVLVSLETHEKLHSVLQKYGDEYKKLRTHLCDYGVRKAITEYKKTKNALLFFSN